MMDSASASASASAWHYERGSSRVKKKKLMEKEPAVKKHYDSNIESMLADFTVPQFDTANTGTKPSAFDPHTSSPTIKFTVPNPKGYSPPEASKHSPAAEIRRHPEPSADRHERSTKTRAPLGHRARYFKPPFASPEATAYPQAAA